MDFNIDLVGFGIAVCSCIAGGFVSVGKKVDAVKDHLHNLELKGKDYVTHATCSDRRDRCPCVKKMDGFDARIRKLER